MSLETNFACPDGDSAKPGLVFDADNIMLAGKFTDELSAYRARKQWREVVNTFFLLEQKRDFEMSVTKSPEGHYVLGCVFHSACGRYAFWRLVNNQAPEIEAKLYSPNMVSNRSARFLLGSFWPNQETGPWILKAEERKRSIFSSLKNLFE